MRKLFSITTFAIASLALLAACSSVDTGEVGIETDFGRIVEGPLEPGLYFTPLPGNDVTTMNVRTNKWQSTTGAYTKDIQTAQVDFVVAYRLLPSKAVPVYTKVGPDWAGVIVGPAVLQAIKNEFGTSDAVDIVARRSVVTTSISNALRPYLAKQGVALDSFDIVNLRYGEPFENAIEAKQVAVQRAIEAQNKTVQVQEEGKQAVIRAEAEAKAIRERAAALAENPKLVEYEAVRKWNGVLPETMMGSTTPFINVNK
jgi:regulator of protease activity HflC (stomatin/prohibitin superfamily)